MFHPLSLCAKLTAARIGQEPTLGSVFWSEKWMPILRGTGVGLELERVPDHSFGFAGLRV